TVDRSDFFFSSRRRHTSSKRDWSSDVCSSDLAEKDGAHLFVGEGFDAGKLMAAEKLERCASTGGDVRNFVGHARLMHGSDGIAAADDGSGAPAGRVGHGLGNFKRAPGKSGHLEN